MTFLGNIFQERYLPHVVQALIDLRETHNGANIDRIVNQVQVNLEETIPQGSDINLPLVIKKTIKKGLNLGVLNEKSRGRYEIKLPADIAELKQAASNLEDQQQNEEASQKEEQVQNCNNEGNDQK